MDERSHRQRPRRRRRRRASRARSSRTSSGSCTRRRRRSARRALPRRRGPPDHRGPAGRREDDARQGARPLARLLLLAPPVHARPAAVGRDRRERLQPGPNEFEFRPGPGVREPPPRRRDQPRLAEDAGRAARVHAGAPGHDRRRHVPARPPFMVMATQNPIEYEGTYPLPEAQLDRFTMRISIGYPPLADEAQMLTEQTTEPPLDSLEPVASGRGARGGRGGSARSSSRRA